MRLALPFAVLALTASPALAQQGWVEIADDVQVPSFGINVDRVDDLDVYVDGREIGDVEEVLGRSAEEPAALVIDFDDDAGYGDRDDVIIPIDRFRLDGNRLMTDVTPAEVAGFPEWND